MALLADDDTQYLRESFAALATDVSLTVVTRERSRLVLPGAAPGDEAEDASAEVKQIVDEVAATSSRIKVEHLDAAADPDKATRLAGEHLPAIVFGATGVKGTLRYFGLPAGYEMSTFVSALMDLGSGEPMVPPEISAELAKLTKPVHVQVFVTPS